MKVYLALDPEDNVRRKPRVAIQTRPFDSGHRPPEHQIDDPGWEYAEGEVDDGLWHRLLAGELSNEEQDELHQSLWSKYGSSPFPEMTE